jgi:hypothetical protein
MPSALPAPEAKPVAVRKMFDRIAPRYDRMNWLMTLGMDMRWRRRVVARPKVGPADTVLDLVCGTGDFSRQVASRAKRVIGADFSRPMLVSGDWGHGGSIPGYETGGGVGPDGRSVTVAVTALPAATADPEAAWERINRAVDAVLCA